MNTIYLSDEHDNDATWKVHYTAADGESVEITATTCTDSDIEPSDAFVHVTTADDTSREDYASSQTDAPCSESNPADTPCHDDRDSTSIPPETQSKNVPDPQSAQRDDDVVYSDSTPSETSRDQSEIIQPTHDEEDSSSADNSDITTNCDLVNIYIYI